MLDVGPETVDVHQFRRLRQQAGGLATSGDYDRAATRLLEANGLWHGQALAGICGDWIARMRDSLEEERRAAILERIGYELELGRTPSWSVSFATCWLSIRWMRGSSPAR